MNADIKSYNTEELTLSLIDNLQNQERSMATLKEHIDKQLHAVRSQERITLEKLSADTSTVVSTLQLLQTEKDKHIKLFSKLLDLEYSSTTLDTIIKKLEEDQIKEETLTTLKELFKSIPLRAKTIRDGSKELAYSLQYALHLGHQMIEAIQGAVSYPPILVYTAEGSKKLSASKRMMVNKVG